MRYLWTISRLRLTFKLVMRRNHSGSKWKKRCCENENGVEWVWKRVPSGASECRYESEEECTPFDSEKEVRTNALDTMNGPNLAQNRSEYIQFTMIPVHVDAGMPLWPEGDTSIDAGFSKEWLEHLKTQDPYKTNGVDAASKIAEANPGVTIGYDASSGRLKSCIKHVVEYANGGGARDASDILAHLKSNLIKGYSDIRMPLYIELMLTGSATIPDKATILVPTSEADVKTHKELLEDKRKNAEKAEKAAEKKRKADAALAVQQTLRAVIKKTGGKKKEAEKQKQAAAEAAAEAAAAEKLRKRQEKQKKAKEHARQRKEEKRDDTLDYLKPDRDPKYIIYCLIRMTDPYSKIEWSGDFVEIKFGCTTYGAEKRAAELSQGSTFWRVIGWWEVPVKGADHSEKRSALFEVEHYYLYSKEVKVEGITRIKKEYFQLRNDTDDKIRELADAAHKAAVAFYEETQQAAASR